jgi:hypothetical protein
MALTAKIVPVTSLQDWQRESMYAVLTRYFDGASREVFERDLEEKHWAVVLTCPETKRLCGFSTLRLIEDEVLGTPVRAFFSGDTIIDRAYWAALALERVWIPFTFSHALEHPEIRYFWFLVVNSYRSFRYLPVYTKDYYPNPHSPMPPFERQVLDQLATNRYGDEYDAKTGLIRITKGWRLRAGVADIGERELRDPRIAFFQRCNPEWAEGAELACLTELRIDNVNRMARRIIGPLMGTESEGLTAQPAALPS